MTKKNAISIGIVATLVVGGWYLLRQPPPAVSCNSSTYVLLVKIDANGQPTGSNAIGKQNCPLIVWADNPGGAQGTLQLTFTRTQGASTKTFHICRNGESLDLPLTGNVNLTSCVVNPGLFGLLQGTTHGDDNDTHRGFKYAVRLGDKTHDPTLIIER